MDQAYDNCTLVIEQTDAGPNAPLKSFETHPHRPRLPDCLIFPPTLNLDLLTQTPDCFLAWASTQHAAGTTICSVCAGAFLVARMGLLKSRTATTHWALAAKLSASFPDIIVDTDKLIIDHGDVMTAGGKMAWMDLGLKLIGRFLGHAAMINTARFFLADVADRQQRFYASFAPHCDHDDTEIARVQEELHDPQREPMTVTQMASLVRLGERTFLRRFQAATRLSPTDYVQRLRVERARALLESTLLSINEISLNVGHADPSSFRKIFHRIMGLSPSDYRRRLGSTDLEAAQGLHSETTSTSMLLT